MALLTTYKTDDHEATALEHMAKNEGLSTRYSKNNDDNRTKNSKVIQKSRKLQNEVDEEQLTYVKCF